MLCLLISTAIVAGEGARELAGDPVPYRAFAREFAAGNYARSSGLESYSTLLIRRNHDEFRFQYEMRTDDGGSFAAAGPARFVGDRVELVVKTLEQNRDFEIDGRHYAVNDVVKCTVIQLDSRIYLIPGDLLARFCNEVNLGTEPRRTTDGRYFFRDLGDKGRATATPERPPHIEKMILVKPVVGAVLSAEDGQAKINLGGRDGVWKEMVLYCEPDEKTKKQLFEERKEDPKTYRALLRVVDVRDTSCVAEIRGVPPSKKTIPIRQGYKVYSRVPDSAIKSGIRTFFLQEAVGDPHRK
jgi:hypothetical protein